MDLDGPNKLLNSAFTDINIPNYPITMPKIDNDGVLPSYRVQLTTKKAVELLLEGTLRSKVCRYCLSVASPLSDLDQIMQIAGKGTLYKVTIRDMVACFHPFKILNDPNFPRKICNKCLNRAISAYLFTQQCEQSERALRNCFDDMYAKLEKLDPLDKTKKRGRQKLNPNYNVLHANHENVIDYAEPIRNLVNVRSVSLNNEPQMSDLECPKCWQIFTKMEDLVVHEKSHPSNMWFNCRLCGRSFVKRLQLKRHLKVHINPGIQPEENHNFQCGTCGFGSKDHSVYLQHIEKHKFQSVLEHIVEKKMDKLCTVCFDKKPKLVELDKMVRLHGGYPGATGDKTLYSILGATLPDRKSYKYQELYVPHHAKIMNFFKLMRDKPKTETRDISECTNQIIISNPLVISNDKFDYDEMYLFFFSDPSYYKESGNEIITVGKNVMIGTAHYAKDEDINVLKSREETTNNREMLLDEQCEINETMVKINDELNKQIDVNELSKLKQNQTIETITPVNETACKICWIFKKPNCKTCIDKQSNITEKASNEKLTKITDENKDKCSYCWIFKRSEKCAVCKNLANITVITNFNKEKETKIIQDTDLQRKRKISDDTKPKNKKWDCQICLTTNTEERLICICCESNRNNQDDISKVNLDFNHAFKIFKANDVSRNQDKHIFTTYEANENDENLQSISMVDTVNIIPEDNTDNFKEIRTSNEDTCKTFDSANLTDRNNIEDYEGMDIAEDDTQIITPNPNPFSLINMTNFNMNTAQTSTNVTTQSTNVFSQFKNLEQSSNVLAEFGLQFYIGTGSSKKAVARRIGKPIRRMAYHK